MTAVQWGGPTVGMVLHDAVREVGYRSTAKEVTAVTTGDSRAMCYLGERGTARRVAGVALTFAIGASLATAPTFAAEPELPGFRRHALDPDSTFPACAALDVNGDGRLDIVSGGWWYESPSWDRHFLREVETIRGRYDDYSNLALDVNGDGWIDLVSANYRSQRIYWIEHPGPKPGPWTTHIADEPGAMETARLADVDGDGRLDVLPNGSKFAAWWEVEWLLSRRKGGPITPRWVRHDLPDEIAGHGIGFGDVDGDGRGDVVGPRGWLAGPEDARRDRWRFHSEFQLHGDASVPILVQDVDGDGDSDLIWGRGHQTGLYWLEQQADTDAAGDANSKGRSNNRRWIQHAIDTSWSQAHSLLSGDLDGDGTQELVAGKRYFGHDGKDVGEYDPLVIFAYRFDRDSRTWHRGVISPPGPAGFDLDPKLADLDADGDLDVIAPSRHGLYWFENLGVDPTSSTTIAHATLSAPSPAEYPNHSDLSVYRDEDERLQPANDPAGWSRRRADVLDALATVMGPLPEPSRRVPLDVRVESETPADGYVRRKLSFAVEPGDRVPAYLLMPEGITRPAPAMLCLHQTTRVGKDEPAGLEGRPTLAYADELARRGYVCLVPDYPSFGEYEYDFAEHTDQYVSGSMKAIWNNVRAIDLLESLPEVDRDSIGCIGHSLGGHNAVFTAVWDLRLQAVVTSCGFTAFHDYRGGDLTAWTSARYMPRIAERFGNDPDRMPFDFPELLAAIAPRAVFVNAPLDDSNFDVGGVRKVESAARGVYELFDAGENFTVFYPDAGHEFPDDIRQAAYEWLDGRLK